MKVWFVGANVLVVSKYFDHMEKIFCKINKMNTTPLDHLLLSQNFIFAHDKF